MVQTGNVPPLPSTWRPNARRGASAGAQCERGGRTRARARQDLVQAAAARVDAAERRRLSAVGAALLGDPALYAALANLERFGAGGE